MSQLPTTAARGKSARQPAAPDAVNAAVEAAFAALNTYDFGSSRAALIPIDEAVTAVLDDGSARQEFERRLLAVLRSDAPSAAKEFVCRKLVLVGSSACVPALRELLAHAVLSTAARTALENIRGDAAAKALRDSVPNLSGANKIGAINSLGALRDDRSVSMLARLLTGKDAEAMTAAVAALGNIGSAHAAKELRRFQPKAPELMARAVADACLICAEHLLVENRRGDALALYKALGTGPLPAYFKTAVARGLAAAQKT
jgi:HEAT repeat protein